MVGAEPEGISMDSRTIAIVVASIAGLVLTAACAPRDEPPPGASPGPPPIATGEPPEPAESARPVPKEPMKPETEEPVPAPVEPAPAAAAAAENEPEAAVADTSPPSAPPLPDPLQEMERQRALRETLDLQRGRLEAKVASAKERVAELEKRLLAVRNPFLPRPQLPPEEEKIWASLDGAERARRVEGQIDEARRELEAAEAELAALPAGTR